MEANPFDAIERAAAHGSRKPAQRSAAVRAVAKARRVQDLFVAACRNQTPVVLEKALFFGGMVAVVYGFAMIYRPLGPIVGGGLAVWLGMLISVERSEPRP